MIHLKADLFVEMDEYIKRANGSTDPEVIAACNNILVAKPLSGSIIGMAMRYSTLAVVSVNGRLDKLWHDYALMHEFTHVARGHIDDPAFTLHQDKGIFTQPVDSRTIPRHELEANLISAEYCINTNSVLGLINYDNCMMRDYRALTQYQLLLCLGMLKSGESPYGITTYKNPSPFYPRDPETVYYVRPLCECAIGADQLKALYLHGTMTIEEMWACAQQAAGNY